MLFYKSLSDRLQSQHEAIGFIIAGVSLEKLTRNPAPGKWSIKDNIAHLARYQPVFIDRINRIISGSNPLFESYVADNDPDFTLWQKWDLQTLIGRLNADRQLVFSLINGLSATQIETTGTHQKFGEMTPVQWTEFFLLHEAHHLFTIFKLAQSNDL